MFYLKFPEKPEELPWVCPPLMSPPQNLIHEWLKYCGKLLQMQSYLQA